MKKINEILNEILNPNANQGDVLADLIGAGRYKSWVVDQFNKGYTSRRDHDIIMKWCKDVRPNLNAYDFRNALHKAKVHVQAQRRPNANFDLHADLSTKDPYIELDDGYVWNSIHSDDVNALINRMGYDCSSDMEQVFNGECDGYSLFDGQDNLKCIFIMSEPPKALGYGAQPPHSYHKAINNLCVKKGIEPVPEAYSNGQLARALATKQLKIDNISDPRELMKRLDARAIRDCKLLNYSHYCSLQKVYDLYELTKLSCLLKYCYCAAVNYKVGPAATTRLAQAVKQNPECSYLLDISSKDTRPFFDEMEKAQAEITAL